MRGSAGGEVSIKPAESIAEIAKLIHERLVDVADGSEHPTATLEQVVFGVRLAVVAMFGDAILGDPLSQAAPEQLETERHRFRAWIADLLLDNFRSDRLAELASTDER